MPLSVIGFLNNQSKEDASHYDAFRRRRYKGFPAVHVSFSNELRKDHYSTEMFIFTGQGNIMASRSQIAVIVVVIAAALIIIAIVCYCYKTEIALWFDKHYGWGRAPRMTSHDRVDEDILQWRDQSARAVERP